MVIRDNFENLALKFSSQIFDSKSQASSVVALVINSENVSAFMLQRRLQIGFNRAARMMEKMEEEGIVGPSEGEDRVRKVLITKKEIEKVKKEKEKKVN